MPESTFRLGREPGWCVLDLHCNFPPWFSWLQEFLQRRLLLWPPAALVHSPETFQKEGSHQPWNHLPWQSDARTAVVVSSCSCKMASRPAFLDGLMLQNPTHIDHIESCLSKAHLGLAHCFLILVSRESCSTEMMRSLEMMSAEGMSWKNLLCGSRMMMLGKQSTMQNFGTMLQTASTITWTIRWPTWVCWICIQNRNMFFKPCCTKSD